MYCPGVIRSQVGDEPAKIYHAGESFYEAPGSHHRISENGSDTESASMLAVFVVGGKDGPLTVPDGAAGGRPLKRALSASTPSIDVKARAYHHRSIRPGGPDNGEAQLCGRARSVRRLDTPRAGRP